MVFCYEYPVKIATVCYIVYKLTIHQCLFVCSFTVWRLQFDVNSPFCRCLTPFYVLKNID